MRVLVTGGAGFIGGHVVDLLLTRGDEVVVLDSFDPAAHRRRPVVADTVDLRAASLLDADALASAVRGVDAVCHQAARVGLGVDFGDVRRYVADNDVGTAALLAALWESRFRGRLVIASSMVVYGEGRYRCPVDGDVRPPPRAEADLAAGRFEPRCPRCGRDVAWASVGEEASLDPRNVYAATKVHGEHLAAAYGREAHVPIAALRYHNVYGPRMPRDTPYAGVASIFASELHAGRAPRVFEDGGQRRDFIHVTDVAHANVLALTRLEPAEGAFNVCSGTPRTVLDLAESLSRALGGPDPVVTGDWRVGDVRHVFASPSRAREVLQFEATVPFDRGVAAFALEATAT